MTIGVHITSEYKILELRLNDVYACDTNVPTLLSCLRLFFLHRFYISPSQLSHLLTKLGFLFLIQQFS